MFAILIDDAREGAAREALPGHIQPSKGAGIPVGVWLNIQRVNGEIARHFGNEPEAKTQWFIIDSPSTSDLTYWIASFEGAQYARFQFETEGEFAEWIERVWAVIQSNLVLGTLLDRYRI